MIESYDLFKGYGIPVLMKDDDSSWVVKETVTRIGIASKKEKKLWASVNLLHKQGYYHILHFKELFLLDGRESDLSENDLARRNTIAFLLDDWGLLTVLDKPKFEQETVDMSQIKVLSYKEKGDWILCQKYSVGNRKNYNSGNK